MEETTQTLTSEELDMKRINIISKLGDKGEILYHLVNDLKDISDDLEKSRLKIWSFVFLRNNDQIHVELNEMVEKIWYNRHIHTRFELEQNGEKIDSKIWETALKRASEVQEKYGSENLEFDDYEWGMLNGKVSALRWVLGDDWDFLDT